MCWRCLLASSLEVPPRVCYKLHLSVAGYKLNFSSTEISEVCILLFWRIVKRGVELCRIRANVETFESSNICFANFDSCKLCELLQQRNLDCDSYFVITPVRSTNNLHCNCERVDCATWFLFSSFLFRFLIKTYVVVRVTPNNEVLY